MGIKINELKVNDIVLAPNATSNRRCIVRAIRNNSIQVDYLDMQTGKMVSENFTEKDLAPISLMESTLYSLNFRKTDDIYYGLPTDTCYILKRNDQDDVVAIKTLQWHLLLPHGDCWSIDKKELYLHTLQNYLSNGKDFADAVSYEKFVELTKPYCISL